MLKIIINENKLQEIYEVAKKENRAVLGVLYNNLLLNHIKSTEQLNPRKINTTKEFILKLMNLDKKLSTEGIEEIYLQYGPSIETIKSLKNGEIIIRV